MFFSRLGEVAVELLFIWIWTKWVEWCEEDSLPTLFYFLDLQR